MLQSFLTAFYRNITKNKTYSFLNIIGLSAGLACFSLIALWVSDELSYDQFNKNYNRIYRLVSTEKTETGVRQSAVSSAPMAAALKQDYPEVENTVRLRMREEIVTFNNQQVLQPDILLTDPSFFDVFSYTLLRGNVKTALKDPYSIILTESSAKKYFGDKDPIGQTLLLNMYDSSGYGALYTITGITADPPKNAHFTFNMLVSFKTIEVADPDVLTIDGWGDGSFYTYLLLKEGVDANAFSRKISLFYGKYVGELFNIWKSIYSYSLQPLRDIHLRSGLQYEIASTGSIRQVYIFATVGLFILLLAGINYTNLATARSLSRAKEVSIKKVVGAGKKQLVLQYLSEAVLTVLLALFISFLLTVLLKPFFNAVTGKDLSLFNSPFLILCLFVITVCLGLLSGIYPALMISSFRPAGILKGSFKSGTRGVVLRKTLVSVQFVITIVLVTGIIVIYSQMAFIKNKDLGYSEDALLFIRVNGNTDVIARNVAFQQELKKSAMLNGITTSNSMIIGGLGSGGATTVDEKGEPLQVNTARLRVDTSYLKVYGIQLLAGRNLHQRAEKVPLREILLNETAVKKFGWKSNEAAIGRAFQMGDTKGIVVGVTNDFHFNSLEESIQPLAIYPLEGRFSRITLSIDREHVNKAVALIEDTWKKHFPAALFDYDFVSQEIREQYLAEERFSKIFLYFSLLSILIACLGLYGLISYTIFQKTKELGIRKVLGATASGIAAMLSGNFLKLVMIACVISVPLAWFLMNQWLENFAYRINLSWWMFAAAGCMVILIALITVSFQSVKAALSNPIKSLRTE
jgi:putative ABC transport system permease protein